MTASAPASRSRDHVLSRPHPSNTASIADALVAKWGELYLLSEPDGQIPVGDRHALGLYARDMRFLDGYELRVAGRAPEALARTDHPGFEALLELTNPELELEGRTIPRAGIGITWRRTLDADRCLLVDSVLIRNHTAERVVLPVETRFSAHFEDVFHVRGLLDRRPSRVAARWDGTGLHFRRRGADAVRREVAVRMWPEPSVRLRDGARVDVTLAPGGSAELSIVVALGIGAAADLPDTPPDREAIGARSARDTGTWIGAMTHFASDSLLLDRVVGRACGDLCALGTERADEAFVAAGVPWFVALFGRDSLMVGWQALAWHPDVAADALRLLARHQAREIDPWRDAEPGKILHELRVGELAGAGIVPHTPYYGTVDATPLFLILLAEHAQWTGRLDLFEDLRDAAEAALAWVIGQLDGPAGFLAYAGESDDGLVNQGWKDSGDAIVHASGRLARPPIAVVEAQGYAVAALRAMAALLDRSGERERVADLRARADRLCERIDSAFWDEGAGLHALALERGGERCAVPSSNPGHLLWSGAVTPERARRVAARLLEEDMFSGWGVRTLGARAPRFNPLGYHLGTVWPHDNAVIAAGLRRYGLDDAARTVVGAVLDAAAGLPGFRLPELVSGLPRARMERPVPYPAACHPQAWGAGSVLALITTTLGLRPAGFERRLFVERPFLPGRSDLVTLRGLRVGGGQVDLRFERAGDDVRVRAEGDVEVVVVR